MGRERCIGGEMEWNEDGTKLKQTTDGRYQIEIEMRREKDGWGINR